VTVEPLKLVAPNAKQRAFIELVADPDDFRPIGEKAREIGYSDQYGRILCRDPVFSQWVLARARERVRGKLTDIYRGLVQDATTAGLEPTDRHRAARIVMQATGEIEGARVTLNDNRNATIIVGQFPDCIRQALSERVNQLQEVGVIDAPRAGNGNGSGDNGRDDSE